MGEQQSYDSAGGHERQLGMEKSSNKAELTQQQRQQLQKQLLDAKEALTSRRSGQLRARTGLLSEVEDEGDAASRANSEDTLVSLAESEHRRIAEIDRALAKFENGEYGMTCAASQRYTVSL